MFLSFVVLFAAIFWTWRVGQTANRLDHELSHLAEHIEEAKDNIHKLEQEQATPKMTTPNGAAKR